MNNLFARPSALRDSTEMNNLFARLSALRDSTDKRRIKFEIRDNGSSRYENDGWELCVWDVDAESEYFHTFRFDRNTTEEEIAFQLGVLITKFQAL